MSNRGLFITMEGGEGVGKSTNLSFLERFLRDNGVTVVTTREPGGTPLGEQIRQLLLQEREEPVSEVAELLLIFAARAQHIRAIIEPSLARGAWVLCDRFTDATYAYQCAGRGVDSETVRLLEEGVQQGLRPDYTLLLDVSVDVGMNRAKQRAALDRFEQETRDFFERVRAGYLQQAKADRERYRVIDAGQSLMDVQEQLTRIGNELLSRSTARQSRS